MFLAWIMSIGWLGVFGQTVPYTVPNKPWNDSLGNHRAVIRVGAGGAVSTVSPASSAVFVDIPWRRRDQDPEKKAILVTNEAGGEINDVKPLLVNREHGEIVFKPVSGAGIYYVYYLPYRGKKNMGYFEEGAYLSPLRAATPDPDWLDALEVASEDKPLERADVVAIQSRTAFDSFYPMEVIATGQEVKTLRQRHPDDFLVFPEDRTLPIRMKDDLPYKWIRSGPSDTFSGIACRNEYFVFQLGLFAAGADIRNVHVDYGGASYPVTCFNLEGYDSKGKYFTKTVDVPKGKVQALWFGVDIPAGAAPGEHGFTVRVSGMRGDAGGASVATTGASGLRASGLSTVTKVVRVRLLIKDRYLADRGDGEAWRGSRLRWLNSRLGIDDSVAHPYTPLRVDRNSIIGKTAVVRLDRTGLPVSVKAGGQELLEAPIRFSVDAEGQGAAPDAGGSDAASMLGGASGASGAFGASAGVRFTQKTAGVVGWESETSDKNMRILCTGSMESDGYLYYRIRVIAKKALSLANVRLDIPVRKDQSAYFMGMGLPGMDCPESYSWKWHGPQNAFWIGNTGAGLYCKFRGATYDGPMLNLYHPAPPPAWYNDNKGGFTLSGDKNAVTCTAYTGPELLPVGDTCDFAYSLLVTPVKQVNTRSQFTDRYYHNGEYPAPSEEDLQSGVKIINVHQGNPVNPYINYPFVTADTIRSFVSTWHKRGLKVKLYYTIRELSNEVTEMWALRSLGTEVLADGNGGGYMWLREHLGDHYTPQWFTPIVGYEACDAAVLTSVDSRWYNYYIEGLRWLLRNTGIDGIYLDDVAFDRSMLKRMRKVMDREKPGCLIDLHSNTGFSKGPATQYTEYFPYINKLWFGESFKYDQMPPANWLVEVSGIPFGLMGDMLQGGGNPWRGMVYGMTVRYPWYTAGVNCDPRAIWKVWDRFGIADAKMIGYWEKEPVVRVSDVAVRATDTPALARDTAVLGTGTAVFATDTTVFATAYVRDDRLLVAVASWAKDTVRVRLDIDWKKIGWRPKGGAAEAPEIPNYQQGRTFGPDDPLEIAPGKGLLLIYQR